MQPTTGRDFLKVALLRLSAAETIMGSLRLTLEAQYFGGYPGRMLAEVSDSRIVHRESAPEFSLSAARAWSPERECASRELSQPCFATTGHHSRAGRRPDSLNRRTACLHSAKNAEMMRYDEYLLHGSPIASRAIEVACRHLVKDRMKRSGRRWTLEGAKNMFHLRAAFQSDHWRTFLDHRIAKGAERVHPHRRLLGDYRPITIAC